MYPHISMLYATYVFEGKWDIENVPALIRPQVEAIIADMTKKPEDSVE